MQKCIAIFAIVAWCMTLAAPPAEAMFVNVGKPAAANSVSANVGSLRQWRELSARGVTVASCAQCRTIVSGVSGKAGDRVSMLREVNDSINRARYVSDSAQWRQADYWATPNELFQKGGDCEDFAIAKMMTLRALGVGSGDMRVLVYPQRSTSQAHAILAVNTESGVMVLDNKRSGVHPISSRESTRYTYAFNDQRVWLNAGR